MVPVSTRPFSILKMESNSTYKLESLGAKHNLKKPLVSIIWSTVWLGLNRHDQTSTHSRDTHRRPKQHLHERETWGTSEFIEFTYTGWVQGDFQEQGLPQCAVSLNTPTPSWMSLWKTHCGVCFLFLYTLVPPEITCIWGMVKEVMSGLPNMVPSLPSLC